MSQEALAKRGGLSADTIRRLEAGVFSPSLHTLRKLALGLDLNLSTIFAAFELGEARHEHEIVVDLLASRSPADVALALRVLVAFFDAIDGRADVPLDDDDDADDEPALDEPSAGEFE